jgi:hypothetical protein
VDPPAVARWKELAAEVRRTENQIQKMRWADSLATLAVATQVDGLAVGAPAGPREFEGFGVVPWITPEHLDTTREVLADRLAQAVPGGSDVVFGYFIQPSAFAAVPGARPDIRATTLLFLGHKGETPICLVVKSTSGPVDPSTYRAQYQGRYIPDLGMWNGCRLAARYGLPGARISTWLERGGMAFGATGPGTGIRDAEASPDKVVRLNLFGSSGRFLARERCLAGVVDGCAMLFLTPYGAGGSLDDRGVGILNSPVSWSDVGSYYSPFGRDDDYLLWDLEREFGPDRFGRFWTSEAGVGEAFQAAFGEPVGEWMARWVATHIGHIQRGAGPAKAAYPGTMALLLFSTLVAGLWARRRRVA